MPWATIFIFAAGKGIGLMLIFVVIVAQFFCGMSSITANSRMVYAFARDGAVPFSGYWHHVSHKARVPVRTAWFGAVFAFILALPYLYNYAAYAAVTSIAVIGLYIAYLTPVFLRRINPSAFEPGPWKLNKTWGPIIGWLAIIWVVFIVILLHAPAGLRGRAGWRGLHVDGLQLHARSPCWSSSASPASGGRSRPASGSRARRSRVPPKSSPRSRPTSASESRHSEQALPNGAGLTARPVLLCRRAPPAASLPRPREKAARPTPPAGSRRALADHASADC